MVKALLAVTGNCQMERDAFSGDYAAWRGTVANVTDEWFYGVTVTLSIFNGGELLGSSYRPLGNLPPKYVESFQLFVDTRIPPTECDLAFHVGIGNQLTVSFE